MNNITYGSLLTSVAPTFVVLACGFALRRFHGLRQEADASLAEFRQRYPQYVVPDDLKQP